MKTWVVLPAYNEEHALGPLLESIVANFKEDQKKFSIVVVNDGSKDNTRAVLEQWEKTIGLIAIHNAKNRGLAETMKIGLMEAVKRASQDDVIVTMDADNTHPAGLALRMTRLVREGNDVVIASRYREGSHVRGVGLGRLILSTGASWLFRIFFPTKGVRDFTCGYRAYRADVLKELISKFGSEFISERGFSCMVGILLRLREQRLVFAEVPLVLRYDLKPGNSKMKVLQTTLETLKLFVRHRFSRI